MGCYTSPSKVADICQVTCRALGFGPYGPPSPPPLPPSRPLEEALEAALAGASAAAAGMGAAAAAEGRATAELRAMLRCEGMGGMGQYYAGPRWLPPYFALLGLIANPRPAGAPPPAPPPARAPARRRGKPAPSWSSWRRRAATAWVTGCRI